MTLNIKDPEAHVLARKLAELTGESLTRAVIEALRERLARISRSRNPDATANELLAIGRRCATILTRKAVDQADLLYDERGLPK
jgi:antitoxin VapB